MSDYTLYQGDCLEVMPTLEKGGVACIFADLPYGVTNSCKWDILLDQSIFWAASQRCLRANGAALLTANIRLAADLLQQSSLRFSYDLIWCKSRLTGFYNAKRQPLRAHEHILCFYNKQPIYNPQKRTNASGRKGQFLRKASPAGVYGTAKERLSHTLGAPLLPTSLVAATLKNSERGLHPTQKPVALLEWLIATYTNPGDLVLDPVFGSGTTGVACANLGRRFVGIEKDPTYFAAGKARIEKAYADAKAGPVQASLAV